MSDRDEGGYRRYRAPQADGQTLIDPPAGELPAQVAANRQAIVGGQAAHPAGFDPAFVIAARQELLGLAHRFTSSFCDVPAPPANAGSLPLVLSGHQPDLFHTGVWFKNFLLDRLAKAVGGCGVHVLIDSDLCRTTGVRSPIGSIEKPGVQTVLYDEVAEACPWEVRPVQSHEALDSFAARAADALNGLVDEPLAASMQSDLTQAARAGVRLGEALSRARRLVEGRWGLANLELPLSAVCETEAFAAFAAMVVTRIEDFVHAYNGALDAYRTAHRLRTPAQPLPDLKSDDPWTETPLWVWTDEAPIRRPAFVRHREDDWVLSDRSGGEWSLGPDATGIAELARQGVRLRSRALFTTLYGRLVLGDLFLHGIGGAKYDHVTDDLARRFFGAAPPPHATVSATLRLPIDFPMPAPGADADSKRRLRDLWFHPERHLDADNPATAELIAAKLNAVREPPRENGSNLARHRQIEQANAALREAISAERVALQARREQLLSQQRAESILGSREYSLCLFPEPWLREQMQEIAGAALPR
ncbi:MAG: hypothetical protein AAGJ46_02060 [Planctomycetota bacterium]